MEIRETSLSFPVVRGSGPSVATATLVFPRQVLKAVAAVRGYQIGFVSSDHHVGQLQVELSTEVNANVVIVTGRLGCRDWSGTWDDEYNGSINVGVLTQLASITALPPRGDLQIMDLEINQATQFFRSADHLDAANVMPDNSMPLVGGKTTGLRFYVDHDALAGSPITSLSGEVTLRSGGATTTITPKAVIAPRRASEIERGSVDHTLNFAIPAEWCRGALEISCVVFDTMRPTARSAAFRRTLQFIDVNPLRVYGVGINYTGAGLDLAAPTQAALLGTFDYTRRVWPTGDVLASGFTTLTFGESLDGVAADGCGSGFNSLLDDLRDIKGDTDDLVYGLLPTGTPLTGVGGCGGNGAGTGMVGDGVTAAHEAGHAVGRKHVSCDDTMRCDSPANTDDDFPHYGNYASDSIGEFGYDPENNVVFNPAVSSDFMGYSGNDWISPYTYKKLLSKGDPVGVSGSARMMASSFAARAYVPPRAGVELGRPEWIRRRIPVLFLSLRVHGDAVELRPSFTYDAHIRRLGTDSDVEVHLETRKGRILACVQLQGTCTSCDVGCGPQQLLGEVPWNDEAEVLIVKRDDREIARFDIEERPSVAVHCSPQKDGILVEWSSQPEHESPWYLVQWRDRDGTWRGVAPRTRDRKCLIPNHLRWATKDSLRLRVLAVSRLNTGSAECEIEAHSTEPPLDLVVREVPGGGVVRATAVDPVGRSQPTSDLVWFDERGGEIARGSDLVRMPGREGVASVRIEGQGVTAPEGFALLTPHADHEPTCGCRPGVSRDADQKKSK